MKSKILTLFILLIGSFCFADHYKNTKISDCRATRVIDYTYFEEGFSTYEYPSVDVRKSQDGHFSISIGSHRAYEFANGDQISLKKAVPVKSTFHILKNEGDQILLEIEWRKTMAKMIVRVKEDSSARFKTVAYGLCNNGFIK